MVNNSNPLSLKITTVVVPATSKVNNEELEKIKELIQDVVLYVESTTKCRYYPVPTIIVDEIPPEDREQFSDPEEHNGDEVIHLFGVYFLPGKTVSKNIAGILKNYGYNDTFINAFATSGFVVIGYNQCKGFAERENKDGANELFWNIFKAVLIHEHAHAITAEGIDPFDRQLYYPVGKFNSSYAGVIVSESIAEWLGLNYFKNDDAIYQILYRHSLNNQKCLYTWPYGGAIFLEESFKNNPKIFIEIFNDFRKNFADAVPLFLSNANEFVIKSFCAFKKGDFQSIVGQIKGNKSVLPEAVKFIEDDCFFVKLIDNEADLNGQDAYGDTALMSCCAAGNLAHVKLLCSKKADVNKQNNNGDTALMIAGLNNRRDILLTLLFAGAKLDVKNNKGKALLDLDISDEIRREATSWVDSANEI